jgi:PTS system nitrogen regulatory IIA component
MPHRILTIGETATYLHVAESDVAKLVKEREIPFELKGGRPVFLKKQLDAWASQRILGMSGTRVSDYHQRSVAKLTTGPEGRALIPGLTRPDRMAPEMTSRTKPSVLRDMVAMAEGTHLVSDAAELLASLCEREELCSTAVPGGFALLHPRHHDPYVFSESFLILGRTIHPIHAGAEDGAPTDLFFLVCCQDDRIHLHTLTRLCTMCLNTPLLSLLRAAGNRDEMFDCLCGAEQEIFSTR